MTSFFKFLRRTASQRADTISVASRTTDKNEIEGPNTLVIFDGKSERIQKFQPDVDECFSMDDGFSKEMRKWGFRAAVCQEEIYIFMNNRSVYRMECANEESKWTRLADMIISHGQYPPVVVMGGEIYVCGAGGIGHETDVIEKFDPQRNRWIRIQNMKTKRRNHCVVAVRNYLYSIGGSHKSTCLETVERYDADVRIWCEITPMKEARHSSAAVAKDDDIFVLGGFVRRKRSNEVLMFNVVTSMWTKLVKMNISRTCFVACFVDGKVWAVGGDNSAADTIEALNADQEKWEFLEVNDTMHINSAVDLKL